MARALLEFEHALANVIEEPQRHLPPARRADVLGVGAEVANHFVDAVDADGGKVVAQGAQVTPGVREQTGVEQALDFLALDFEARRGELEQFVEPGVQRSFVAPVEVTEARAVERDDAQRPRLFRRTEQTVAALEQFAQVELQPAAH